MNFLQRLQKIIHKQERVQIFLTEKLTPFGQLTIVEEDYLVIEQDKDGLDMKNTTMIIPINNILYVRPLK